MNSVVETPLQGRLPHIVIEPSTGVFNLDLRSVWHYRELLYFLIWRDLKVRYKQTVIGGGWAILQPLLTVLIFTLIFGKFARIGSEGYPYAVFAYAALLPWNYFSQAVSRGSASLVSSANLVTKVYFPRLIIPLAAVTAPLVDFALAFLILIGMMVWYQIVPNWGVLLLPVFVLLAFSTALAVNLLLSPLNVKYRDISHTIPFLTQFWLFASPVAYSVTIVPEKWRLLYSLNPMVGVIEGFRWALLGKKSPELEVIFAGSLVVIILFVLGLIYFKRMEDVLADVI